MTESELVSSPKREIAIPIDRTEAEVLKTLEACGVSKRYLSASMDDIDPKLRQSFLHAKNESYFLWGNPGTGKTHLVSAIVAEIVRSAPPKHIYEDGRLKAVVLPQYPSLISVPDLLLEIREAFRDGSQQTESDIIDCYTTGIKSLILDDLGVEKTTDWSLQTLYSIIDRRYRDMRQTIITSNLSLKGIAEKVGDRIASRISEMCRVVELKGRDRRVKP